MCRGDDLMPRSGFTEDVHPVRDGTYVLVRLPGVVIRSRIRHPTQPWHASRSFASLQLQPSAGACSWRSSASASRDL